MRYKKKTEKELKIGKNSNRNTVFRNFDQPKMIFNKKWLYHFVELLKFYKIKKKTYLKKNAIYFEIYAKNGKK